MFLPSPDDLHADHRALARAALPGRRVRCRRRPVPALFAYRVYPEAGLWPAGATSARRPLRSQRWRAGPVGPRASLRDRDLALHAPDAGPAKARAIAAYVSQSRLLGSACRRRLGHRGRAVPADRLRPS